MFKSNWCLYKFVSFQINYLLHYYIYLWKKIEKSFILIKVNQNYHFWTVKEFILHWNLMNYFWHSYAVFYIELGALFHNVVIISTKRFYFIIRDVWDGFTILRYWSNLLYIWISLTSGKYIKLSVSWLEGSEGQITRGTVTQYESMHYVSRWQNITSSLNNL